MTRRTRAVSVVRLVESVFRQREGVSAGPDASVVRGGVIVGLSAVFTVLALVGWLAFRGRAATEGGTRSVTGEVMAYEAGRQDLALRTDRGDRHFIVRAGTPVQQGAGTTPLSTLASASRCRAKVWYQEGGEGQIAREIRIWCTAAAAPAAMPARQ